MNIDWNQLINFLFVVFIVLLVAWTLLTACVSSYKEIAKNILSVVGVFLLYVFLIRTEADNEIKKINLFHNEFYENGYYEKREERDFLFYQNEYHFIGADGKEIKYDTDDCEFVYDLSKNEQSYLEERNSINYLGLTYNTEVIVHLPISENLGNEN